MNNSGRSVHRRMYALTIRVQGLMLPRKRRRCWAMLVLTAWIDGTVRKRAHRYTATRPSAQLNLKKSGHSLLTQALALIVSSRRLCLSLATLKVNDFYCSLSSVSVHSKAMERRYNILSRQTSVIYLLICSLVGIVISRHLLPVTAWTVVMNVSSTFLLPR